MQKTELISNKLKQQMKQFKINEQLTVYHSLSLSYCNLQGLIPQNYHLQSEVLHGLCKNSTKWPTERAKDTESSNIQFFNIRKSGCSPEKEYTSPRKLNYYIYSVLSTAFLPMLRTSFKKLKKSVPQHHSLTSTNF